MVKQSVCTAGFAKLDVTPPLGVHMGGYYNERVSKGVLDPLFVRAVAFGEGEKSAVLLVVDNCGFNEAVGHLWPIRVAEAIGLPREAVFLCHTHSHTTPVVHGSRFESDAQYDAWLFRRLCDAARLALDDRKPVVDVRSAELETENLAFVRRYRMKNGEIMTNPPPSRQDEIEGPADVPDRTLRMVRILRQDAPEIILVNFQVHPDSIGGELISADYPGQVCREVERRTGNAFCVYTNGAEGQMVRGNRMSSVRYTKGYDGAMKYGTAVADAAMSLYDKTVSTGMTGLKIGQSFAHAKTKRGTVDPQEAERIIALHEAGRVEEICADKRQAMYAAAVAYIIRGLEKEKADYLDLPVTAFAFCGLALVAIPGEPFCQVGQQIRAQAPYPVTCVCCLANGTFGYFPMANVYNEGGYEGNGAHVVAGGAELLVETAVQLLKSFTEETGSGTNN